MEGIDRANQAREMLSRSRHPTHLQGPVCYIAGPPARVAGLRENAGGAQSLHRASRKLIGPPHPKFRLSPGHQVN
jgi:hypothetical protein